LSDYRTPGDLLRARAKEDGAKVFALFHDQTVTFADLNAKSDRLANALIQLRVKKGQKIAIISHSSLEYLVCEYAIFKAGAVCVPINCMLKAQEFSYLLNNSDVVLAFVHSNYLQEFLSAVKGKKDSMQWYEIEDGNVHHEKSMENLLQSGEESRPKIETSYDDPCCILYTSGTSGPAKGVVYENYGLLPLNGETYVQQMMDVIQLRSQDTTYLPFPLYHILGQVHVIGALRNGGRIALAERFSGSQFWSDVRKFGATVLVHQGASIPILLKQAPSDLDRKHNARLSVGAGVPNEDVWKKFEERFGVKIFEHYAQTEGAFFGAGTMPTNKAGTIGQPFSSAKIRIVDNNDLDVKNGELGQLISKLKHDHARKIPGALYYKDHLKGESRFTSDGWFRSGDIVRRDAEGYLHYVGKVETFIRYRGENISPLQIESVLSKHPCIEECIAVGVPNSEFGGDDIKIVVVMSKQPQITPVELVSWCEKMMPKFMVPRYVEFVPELKKTEQTKKIVRGEYTKNSDQTWDRLR
jgi:carnitine-CoA ligase